MNVSDLVILISGGSRGLGQAVVQRMLDAGNRVATFSRTATPFVKHLCSDPAMKDRFLFAEVDAQNAEALRAFVAAAHEKFGRIDALLNNAGVAHGEVLAMTAEKEIERMLDVNLKAALLLAKECARLMLLAESGNIVSVSSIVGERGFSGLAAYSATKAGIAGMTRALARELGPRNIRVNAIAPGYLETEMSHGLTERQRAQIVRRTPLGRLGRIEDVVPWIEFLLSPESGFLTGQVIVVDGGASV